MDFLSPLTPTEPRAHTRNQARSRYFAYPDPKGAILERLEVDTYGEILNWPPDFFGDELEDLAVQAEVGMQRRMHLRA